MNNFIINAQEKFEKKVFTESVHDSLLYNILLPKNYSDSINSTKKYPLVIFLHGSGERGNDNEKQIIHIKNLFLNPINRKKYPAFVIAPQCPTEKRWLEKSWKLKTHTKPEKPSVSLATTIKLVDSLIKTFAIDTTRIYITGLSMGGFGTWDIIAHYPKKFAAAIPICGGGDEKTAKLLKDIPIWAFHGANDKVVSVNRSRNMINALQKAGGKPKYTEYPGVGHGSWVKAYKEKELLEWLFDQSIKQ